MKTKETGNNRNSLAVHSSSGNVFADLGLPDAGGLLVKAELANEICALIKSAKLTQVKVARLLGVDQPKISALMRGRLKDFSTDRLTRFVTLLGRDIRIVIGLPERRQKTSIGVLAETRNH